MLSCLGFGPGFARAAPLCLALGCGGVTSTSQKNDAGTLAECGSNCSPAQLADACSAACDKIARARCSSASSVDCATSCESLPSMAPACVPLAYAFLRCLASAQPTTCSTSGAVVSAACDPAQQAVTECLADSGVLPSPPAARGGGPPGSVCASVPADVCPGIPRPTGVSSCSGSGGAGPNAPVMTTTQCQDPTGNTWQASCTGSTCICTYKGSSLAARCTCTMTGPNNTCPCCPGTG